MISDKFWAEHTDVFPGEHVISRNKLPKSFQPPTAASADTLVEIATEATETDEATAPAATSTEQHAD